MQSCITAGCGGDFIQVGIDSNNVGACGNGNGGGNTAPEVFFQVAVNGTFETAKCLTNYIFGVGSQTFFWIGWDASNRTWYAWIDWNNTWEEVNALGQRANSSLDMPTGATFPARSISSARPTPSRQASARYDQQGQFYAEDGTTGVYFWEWWFNDIPTSATRQGPYCLFFPTQYTNNSVKDGAC